MNQVTVSSKFQVVIPRKVPESMNIQAAGTGFRSSSMRIASNLIPVKGPKSLRGFIKGIDTEADRSEDRV